MLAGVHPKNHIGTETIELVHIKSVLSVPAQKCQRGSHSRSVKAWFTERSLSKETAKGIEKERAKLLYAGICGATRQSRELKSALRVWPEVQASFQGSVSRHSNFDEDERDDNTAR